MPGKMIHHMVHVLSSRRQGETVFLHQEIRCGISRSSWGSEAFDNLQAALVGHCPTGRFRVEQNTVLISPTRNIGKQGTQMGALFGARLARIHQGGPSAGQGEMLQDKAGPTCSRISSLV